MLSLCPRVCVFLMTSQEMTGLTGQHPNELVGPNLLINKNIIDLMTKQLSIKIQANLEENLEKSLTWVFVPFPPNYPEKHG